MAFRPVHRLDVDVSGVVLCAPADRVADVSAALAAGEVRRTYVALVHGYGEHAGRYARMAKAFNAQGIAVVGADLRGYGLSSGKRGSIRDFEEYLLDIDAIVGRARERAGGGPVGLLGHSMGGLAVCDWLLQRGPQDLSGAALSSPFLGLARRVPRFVLFLLNAASRLSLNLSFGEAIPGKDVTRDPLEAERYDADPLILHRVRAPWLLECLKAMDRVHARAGELQVPLLLLYAGADRVVSVAATDAFASRLSLPEREVERLEDCFHEILNEIPEVRDAVTARIAAWFLAQPP